MNEVFNGFAETNEGVLHIRVYGPYTHVLPRVNYWDVSPDRLHPDELISTEDFIRYYGLKLYQTLEDFKRGNSISADKVLV